MFLHINTFGRQYSVHSKGAVEAKAAVKEIKDDDGNVTVTAVPAEKAKDAEPLLNAIQDALDYWDDNSTDLVAIKDGVRLDLSKTAEGNGLKENDHVTVVTQKSLDEVVELKQVELDAAKALAGK